VRKLPAERSETARGGTLIAQKRNARSVHHLGLKLDALQLKSIGQ